MVERLLLLGLGVFLLTVFLSIAVPFLYELESYDEKLGKQLIEYNDFIEQIDGAIFALIENPSQYYNQPIKFPDNLNVSVYKNYVRYDYLLNNSVFDKNKQYGVVFNPKTYHNMVPITYRLIIYCENDTFFINFKLD